MKKLLAILLSVGILIGTVSLTAFTANLTPEITIEEFTEQLGKMNQEYKDEPVSNRLIVKSKHDIPILDGVGIVEGYDDIHIVQFDNRESAEAALDCYNNMKTVEYAETDSVVTINNEDEGDDEITPTKEHLSWGAASVDYDGYISTIDVFPTVVVAVIDTGVDYNHEFLQDRIIRTNYNISSSGNEGDELDDHGHGTHVAGTIVDCTSDNVKVAGYKCLDKRGSGTLSLVTTSIKQAVNDQVDVINMSLGSPLSDKLMEDTINQAIAEGITVCVSAGNEGWDVQHCQPANIEACITVAAIDENDNYPNWTNYGDGVDIIAPGVKVYSCWKDGGYKEASGTSMACPHVSAAAALVKTKYPSYSPENIRNYLVINARAANGLGYHTEELNKKVILMLGPIEYDTYVDRPSIPVFSVNSGRYQNAFDLEITCASEGAEIYYNLFDYGQSLTFDFENAVKYEGPITIDRSSRIIARAYYGQRVGGQINSATYSISGNNENDFIINEQGTIIEYRGNEQYYLVVPDTVDGVTVTGIGEGVFEKDSTLDSTLIEVSLPYTCEYIGQRAFKNCRTLSSFYGGRIKNADIEAFYECAYLDNIELSYLETVEESAFSYCGLKLLRNDNLEEIPYDAFSKNFELEKVELPNVKTIGEEAFMSCQYIREINISSVETLYGAALADCCNIEELFLPNLTALYDDYVFGDCYTLKNVYMPKLKNKIPIESFAHIYQLNNIYCPLVEIIEERVFDGCKEANYIFAPNATTINSLPNHTTIYCSDKLTTAINDTSKECIVIAPGSSYAESWANENGYAFIDSDTMVDAIGTHTDENGNSVFEFGWRNIDELEQLASKVEYSAEGATVGATIGRPPKNDGVTYFQVSGENELRGCVNIDGMIFRSAPLTVGENELEPENGCEHDWQIVYTVSVPNDTIVVFRCDECDSYYRVSFMEHINTDYPLLDMNHDNIINAKDLAYIIKEPQRS